MSIFEKVKQVSVDKGYSLRQIEDSAGLSPKSLYNWKKSSPKLENVKKVADVLNVSVDYLLGNTDEMHPATGSTSNGDLKEFFEESPILSFDGKEIPQEDLKIIKRILESMDDE